MEKKVNCVFCNDKLIKHPHFEQFGLRNDPDKMHIFETKNIFVKPELLSSSPEGLHLLVVPKIHRLSFWSLPELSYEVGQIIEKVETEFGRPFVFFEHGSLTQEGSKLQSVYHQHGHLIPDGSKSVLAYMEDRLKKNYQITYEKISTPDKSPIPNLRRYVKGFNYLYIQQGREGLIAHDHQEGKPADVFPSQITQKSMSLLLSNIEADWKQLPKHQEYARLSAQRIAALINLCYQGKIL